MKPQAIGTVWTARARIRYIDAGNPPKWVTVASCIDTPAAIGKALALADKTHTLWVHSDTNGKYIA